MKYEDIFVELAVEARLSTREEIEAATTAESVAFVREYLEGFLPTRPIFVSCIYLWSMEWILGEINTLGSLPHYLKTCGYLPFGSNLSADFLCVCETSGDVFWAPGSIFLDGLDELIVTEDGVTREEPPTRAGFEKTLIFMGSFNPDFIESVLRGKYATLLEILRNS
jgi:hypothetical protein